MTKKRAVIVGYGNVGKYVLEALAASRDFEAAGVVRRSASAEQPPELSGITVTEDFSTLEKIDVAILCSPTRSVPDIAVKYAGFGVNTVDSYDIHTGIWDYKVVLDAATKKSGTVAVVAAGWDPGSDSIVRALMRAAAPRGITYTNFGPGMSMGHTVAVKAVEGVKKALSMTVPLGAGLHRRMVYIELEQGFEFADVETRIKNDEYFIHDETHVFPVDDVEALIDMGSGVHMTRKGVSGWTQNQLFDFQMKINNPALTAQMLVAAARAGFKQNPGAYTLPELPVIDMLYGEKEALIRELV